MPIFTADERERLRDELVSAAQNDPNLCGAAHIGSAASFRLDRGRILQAEYMLSGMRNHVGELTCLRCSVIAQQGRL